MKLIAYHNDPAIKAGLIANLKAHEKADAIIHGTYWENGKGCAIGCQAEHFGLANHGDHAGLSKETGFPEMLLHIEDTIFEGLTNGKAKAWPVRFSQAIKPGADLSLVGWKFQYWILTKSGLLDAGGNEHVMSAIKQAADVIAPLTKGLPVDKAAAESAAWAAARAAGDAAESAARSAWSAAESAGSAGDARYAAGAAAWAAAWAAGDAARSAAYELMAEKLLRLLRAAK